MTEQKPELLEATVEIVAAHVGHNRVAINDVPGLVRSVYETLERLSCGAAVEITAAPVPAVPVRNSVRPNYIVCLEDGRKLQMLKRYLRTHFQMTPDQYRAKWGLASDYPMVAPAYSQKRSALALKAGLGKNGARRGGRKPAVKAKK